MNRSIILLLLLFTAYLHADRSAEVPHCSFDSRTISTLYGTFEIQENVIWELLEHPVMQRLKGVHQYGISYFVDPDLKQYTRFDHSVGVFALLRRYGACLNEQIAGLLHDASHTVFSHTGDYLLSNDYNSAYQDDIHAWYLAHQGVESVLAKYGISIADVLAKNGLHLMLEQELPDLCADRIEYNIQEGLMNGMLVKEEVPRLLDALRYDEGRWFFTESFFAKKLAHISMYGTEYQWGGPNTYIKNIHAAKAMRYALDTGILSMEDIHFSQDSHVWQRLNTSSDPTLQALMLQLKNYKESFEIRPSTASDAPIRTKLRVVNPYVQSKDGALYRLSDIDETYHADYEALKRRLNSGWAIKTL